MSAPPRAEGWPDLIATLPAPALAFGPGRVNAHLLTGGPRQVVFFDFPEDLEVPPHAHGAQWGVVMAGHLTLTIDGQTHRYGPGDSYHIPADAVHSARVEAGCRLIDVFAEPDRYRPAP